MRGWLDGEIRFQMHNQALIIRAQHNVHTNFFCGIGGGDGGGGACVYVCRGRWGRVCSVIFYSVVDE